MEQSCKKSRSFIYGLLAMVLIVGTVFITSSFKVTAVSRVTVPSNTRCGVGMRNSSSITVRLVTKGDYIKNLKSNSKNLVVRQTYRYDASNPYVQLQFYAKKKGTYRIRFNVHHANNKKYTSRSIKVHAAGTGGVIASCAINGKNVMNNSYYSSTYYTTKKSGKVRFKLSAGYKISKIDVIKYDQNGNSVPKRFKNGKSIKYGVYGYSYYSNSCNYSVSNKGFFADTQFRITYKDNYNNTTGTTSFFITRPATRWY